MTIPKALPPGTNHRTASEALAKATEAHVAAGSERQAAPRPAGPKPNPVAKHFATTTGK
jgi:hypothetical protein